MASNEIVLIDTSAWICFFARKGFHPLKRCISDLLEEDRAAVTGPILVELIQGCRIEKEKETLKEVLTGLRWLAIQDILWEAAADLAFTLRRRGVTTSVVDSLIAVVAMNYQASLLHHDKDYDFIAKYTELKIYQP
jgi:predicted nucleic acid-binding protein